MASEIERKFLVTDGAWRAARTSHVRIEQGYLSLDPERTVRVRLADGRGTLTVKGKTRGATRSELEWEIPAADARDLLESLCLQPLVVKTRSRVPDRGLVWEVDEFEGTNHGLVVAEVELEREDQEVARPAWIGAEVTGDPRYYNSSLVRRPFTRWVATD